MYQFIFRNSSLVDGPSGLTMFYLNWVTTSRLLLSHVAEDKQRLVDVRRSFVARQIVRGRASCVRTAWVDDLTCGSLYHHLTFRDGATTTGSCFLGRFVCGGRILRFRCVYQKVKDLQNTPTPLLDLILRIDLIAHDNHCQPVVISTTSKIFQLHTISRITPACQQRLQRLSPRQTMLDCPQANIFASQSSDIANPE